MTFGVNVTVKGPFFESDPIRALDEALDQAVLDAGEYARDQVQDELTHVLVNPTGFYRSRITLATRQDNAVRVSDGGVIYGPWLAGVSSRNERSRFKGYAHWRRAHQRTEEEAERIAERRIGAAVAELNG